MARDHGPREVAVAPKMSEGVVVDIDEGSTYTVDENGPHALRTARVRGLKGSPAVRAYYATRAPRIPQHGQGHPVFPSLPVKRVHAELIKGTTDQATVTIEYGYSVGGPAYFTNVPGDGVDTLPQLEVLSTVQPATTQFELLPDGTEKQIVVSYLKEDEETGTTTAVTQAGSVEYMLPMETVRYMRREAQNPQAKNRMYVGRINSISVFQDAPHMWLCSRLDGVSDDGGVTFNVTYEFQRNPDSWNPFVTPTDPETGQPRVLTPEDLALPDGARTVRILPEANFWDLNLVLP